MNVLQSEEQAVVRAEEPVELSGWSKRRWFWSILLVFIVQVSLTWHFSEETAITPPLNTAKTVFRLGERSNRRALEWYELNDPTLFALVSPRGFSGSAWLRLAPFPYQLTNEAEPPRWFEGSLQQFGSAIVTPSLPAETIDRLLSTEKPPPLLFQVPLARGPLFVEPLLRMEGDLAQWRLISTNALPPAEPDIVLSNCVVQVTVNSDGDVISATPLSTSGSANADNRALNFAKSARFVAPAGDAPAVIFGRLVFQWFAGKFPEANAQTKDR